MNTPPAADETMTPGQRLRAAREAMGQSAADIATRLRMGVKQVQALELGDYAALPTGTFLRGFVRNYAKVVGLEPSELVASLEQTHSQARAVPATPVVEPARQKMAVREAAGLFSTPQMQGVAAAFVILLLGAAVAYWWTQIRTVAPRLSSTPVSAPLGEGPAKAHEDAKADAVRTAEPSTNPPISLATPVDTPAAPSVAVAQPQVLDHTPSQTAVAQPTSESASKPGKPVEKAAVPVAEKPKAVEPDKKPRAAGTSVVGFTFSGESWVEVTDANGRVVLSKKFRAGEAEEISGRGPLAIVIGNASNTRMALNGLEFDLAPHTRGAVARVNAK